MKRVIALRAKQPLQRALGVIAAAVVIAPAVIAQRSYGPGVCGPLDPAYVRTATETGGQPFPMAPSEAAKTGAILAESSRSDATIVLWAGGAAADAESGFTVPIDSSVTRVTFSITFDGAGGQVEIARPDGSVMQAGSSAGDTLMHCGRILSIDTPAPGAWRIRPVPTNRFWAVVHARSTLDLLSAKFMRLGGRPGHEGLFPIQGMPIAGRPATLRVELSEPQSRTPTFLLISSQGRTLRRVALARVNPEEYVGAMTLPAVPFRVAVAGTDDRGTSYLRLHATLFRAESIEVVPVSVGDVELTSERDTPLAFIVKNHGARARYRIVATVGADVMKRVEPSLVDIDADSESRVSVWLPASIAVAGTTIELLVVASDEAASLSTNSALQRVSFVK